MNKKFFDILYVILIISLILFMAFIVYFMETSSTQCLKNPVKYFEIKNDAMCFCIKDNQKYEFDSNNSLKLS